MPKQALTQESIATPLGRRGRWDTPVPQTITIVYLGALAFIAAIALFSHVLMQRVVERQESSARVVNLAGRQRMLAQRTTRIADEMAAGLISVPEGRAGLRQTIDRIRHVEDVLTQGNIAEGIPSPASPALQAIYFHDRPSLQDQISIFLRNAGHMADLDQPNVNDPALREMRQAVNGPLLDALDRAVRQYQMESESAVGHLRRTMAVLTGVMISVLVLEALLIYRPLFNRLTYVIQQLVQVSTTDSLTGVLNRAAVLDRLQRELASAQRSGDPLTVIMADLDRFKSINDTYGHAAGDEVLRRFTVMAQRAIRQADTLGRLGGEEFCMILRGTPLKGGVVVADRIGNALAATPVALPEHTAPVYFTCSMGIAAATTEDTSQQLLARADTLLYRAKNEGRNRAVAE